MFETGFEREGNSRKCFRPRTGNPRRGLMGQTEEAPPRAGGPGRVDRIEAGNDLAQRKRAAVELIHRHDTALRSSARRYSICGDDADDAYQRGIEICLLYTSPSPRDS